MYFDCLFQHYFGLNFRSDMYLFCIMYFLIIMNFCIISVFLRRFNRNVVISEKKTHKNLLTQAHFNTNITLLNAK